MFDVLGRIGRVVSTGFAFFLIASCGADIPGGEQDDDSVTELGDVVLAAGESYVDLVPEADTYVDSRAPTTSFGGADEVEVGGSPQVRNAFLRFHVALPSDARVTAADLILTAGDNPSATSGGSLRVFQPTNVLWSETAATWNNPIAGSDASSVLASVGGIVPGSKYVFSGLGGTVPTNGRVTFVLRSSAEDGAAYRSREYAAVPSARPTLRVRYTTTQNSSLRIGIQGDKFTLNGAPTFLLGASYFDGRSWRASDLDVLAARKFNLIRVFLDLASPEHSFFSADGTLVYKQVLLDLVRACAARGIVVDVTILLTSYAGKDTFYVPGTARSNFEAQKAAVRNTVTALVNETNVFFDVANEHEIPYALSHSQVATLIQVAKAANPSAIVTVSSGGSHLVSAAGVANSTNIQEEVQAGISMLTPHFARTNDWYDRTDDRVRALKQVLTSLGRTMPVYLQEEKRRDLYDTLSDPTKAQFIQAAKEAKTAGAAAWVFHTEAGFYPALFNAPFYTNLDSEERATVDALGNEIFGTNDTTVDIIAEADTHIDEGVPSMSFGVAPEFEVGGDIRERKAFLRFFVNIPSTATVLDARLIVVGGDNPSTQSGGTLRRFFPTVESWTETTPTWNNPLLGIEDTTTLGTIGAVSPNTSFEFRDLSSVIPKSGRVTFVIRSTADDGAGYRSREHADPSMRPRLRVTYR